MDADLAVLPKADFEAMRSTADVIARAERIKEIQVRLMKEHVHYGTIPGTSKPTLYQPGADVLCVAFRIAPKIAKLDDLSHEDCVRYRVTVAGINQLTGETLAEGIGEASTDEERYRWRRAVCEEEFNETAVDRRREKWAKGSSGKGYKSKQVRTNIADVSNTVLKIATKRAKVAMTLNATAASDVFAQDLEDLTTELREQLAEDKAEETQPEKPAPKPAQRIEKPGDDASREAVTRMPVRGPSPAPVAIASESSTGRLHTVNERGGGAVLIELDTEFVCSTRDPKLIAELLLLQQEVPPPIVTLVTRPSSDPEKFAPVLTQILPGPA